MTVYLMNLQPLNLQALAVLRRYGIACDLTQALAGVELVRVALERGLVSLPMWDDPMALVATMRANPVQAMQWMTESEPGVRLDWDLSPDLAGAAAEILEEVWASIQALPG
jgi:hypothetical protein